MVRLFRVTLLSQLTDQPHQHRCFSVSGHRFSRRQVWAQGLQNTEDPSCHYSRLDCVLLDYLHVSLRIRDDAVTGKGEHPCYLE